MVFLRPLEFSKELLKTVLRPGHWAVDATAGNGYDTLFLARAVGPTGHVWAFDIQRQALANVEDRLQKAQVDRWVTLIHDGHEKMANHIPGPVAAIMFNLGYLPGGDHWVITTPPTTMVAVQQGLELLSPGGLLSLVVYTGHEGGLAEGEVLDRFCRGLPQEQYQVIQYGFINQRGRPPYVVAIKKMAQE